LLIRTELQILEDITIDAIKNKEDISTITTIDKYKELRSKLIENCL